MGSLLSTSTFSSYTSYVLKIFIFYLHGIFKVFPFFYYRVDYFYCRSANLRLNFEECHRMFFERMTSSLKAMQFFLAMFLISSRPVVILLYVSVCYCAQIIIGKSLLTRYRYRYNQPIRGWISRTDYKFDD